MMTFDVAKTSLWSTFLLTPVSLPLRVPFLDPWGLSTSVSNSIGEKKHTSREVCRGMKPTRSNSSSRPRSRTLHHWIGRTCPWRFRNLCVTKPWLMSPGSQILMFQTQSPGKQNFKGTSALQNIGSGRLPGLCCSQQLCIKPVTASQSNHEEFSSNP